MLYCYSAYVSLRLNLRGGHRRAHGHEVGESHGSSRQLLSETTATRKVTASQTIHTGSFIIIIIIIRLLLLLFVVRAIRTRAAEV